MQVKFDIKTQNTDHTNGMAGNQSMSLLLIFGNYIYKKNVDLIFPNQPTKNDHTAKKNRRTFFLLVAITFVITENVLF